MNFLLTPQWTWVADRLQNHRTVLAVNNVGSSLAAVGLVALRPASTTIATTTSLGDSSVDDGTATFIWAIMAVAAFAACLAPLNSILDLVVLRVLQGGAAVDAARTSGHVNAEASGDAEVINGTVGDTSKADGHDLAHYGQQRMWGSLAYGGAGYIVAALMGPSLSQSRESNGGGSDTSGNAASAFHTIFYAYMIAVGVCFTAVLYWPQGTRQSGWREHVGGATAGAVKPTTSAAATATAPLESAIIERSSATNTGDNAVWLSMSRSGELESNAGAVTATASSPHSCRRESTISLQSFTVPPVPALATLSGVPKEEKVAATSFFGAVKTIYAFESTAGTRLCCVPVYRTH